MNHEIWDPIERFEFDQAVSGYGFITRLAFENNWTAFFTLKAIEEYKKFMYLAAVENVMVSPSKIVDVVWHQHLIFTRSYNDFCSILGKRIEHIPSTHNPQEKEKFDKAAIKTKELYERNFGEQPKEFWFDQSFEDSFTFKPSKVNVVLQVLIAIGIMVTGVFLSVVIYMISILELIPLNFCLIFSF